MKTFEEIEKYAKEKFVPIARKDFVEFFKNLIIENNYHEILEIGSAIGYTTIHLALLENVYVTTIEYKAFVNCSNLTIHCQAEAPAIGWNPCWNCNDEWCDGEYGSCSQRIPTEWGYTGE